MAKGRSLTSGCVLNTDDGVINACTPSPDVCGELAIALQVPDVAVSWQSDCVLQTADSLDNPTWQDFQGPVEQTGCAREALFSTQAPMKYFRLRLP